MARLGKIRNVISGQVERLTGFKIPKSVKLFVPPGHFYSPIVEVDEAARHLARIEHQNAVDALPGIAIDRAGMVETWNQLVPYLQSCPFPETGGEPGFRYAFENQAYSWGDGSVLHAMLRHHRPKRLVEIGSGWSSACTLDTIDHCLDGKCDVTFVEPYPQLLQTLLGGDVGRVKILNSPVQDVPLDVFMALEAGDILFIDSTHVFRTGSDVCFELFEILPNLAPGVVVHIHDMFWPFEYPSNWVLKDNRSWNELYAVRAFLMNNDAWRVLFFNDYFLKFEREKIEQTHPDFLRNPGGALWLQKA